MDELRRSLPGHAKRRSDLRDGVPRLDELTDLCKPRLVACCHIVIIGHRGCLSRDMAKGYEREWFEESWALYLPPDSPLSLSTPDSNRDTVTTRDNTGESGVFQSVTAGSCHASENAVSASKNAPCHGVTVQKQGDREKQMTAVI